jgi:hypothetical protein
MKNGVQLGIWVPTPHLTYDEANPWKLVIELTCHGAIWMQTDF